MRYCNVGEVCIDDLYNLIIVIFQILKIITAVYQCIIYNLVQI